MTAVQVNLLPPEIAQRAARRRMLVIVGGLLAVYVLLLGALYLVKLAQVNRTRAERDAAQAEVTSARSELVALAPYQVLDSELDQRNAILAQAMAGEVSPAGLLGELAVAFPAASSLRTLTLTMERANATTGAPPVSASPTPVPPATDGTEGVPAPPVAPPADPILAAEVPVGTLSFEGYTVEEYAPGVLNVVMDLRSVPAFVAPVIQSAQDVLIGDTTVTSFDGGTLIDASAYTRRYEDGLDVRGLR